MLGYLLAVLVGAGSAGLYLAAFFFPEIHRKPDFIWGGVGLFYALVLWIYAPGLTGGILVGQAASVALLGWFGWQTVKLRQLVPIDWQTSLPITKTQERSDSKSANSTPAKPTAKKPNGKSSVASPSLPAETSDSRVAKPVVEPKSQPAAPAAKSTPKPAPGNESVRVEVGTSAPAEPPSTRIIPDPAIEQDEEAWIRLEVKPSPDASTLIKEVTRSTSSAKPQPLQETVQPPPPTQLPSPPATSQPDRFASGDAMQTVQSPPPPSPAVIKATAPVKPVADLTPPPALLAAAKPLGEATQPPNTPPPKPETATTSVENSQPPQIKQTAPTEQTGDLDRLIAELESEIKD